MKRSIFFLLLFMLPLAAFAQEKSGAQQFFDNLKRHEGKAYAGTVTEGAREGDDFSGKDLVMHVLRCEENRIYIPFNVGDNRSRTWILTLENDRILLKHDHRHEDGSDDKVTMYGGWSTNVGTGEMQMFPADQETAALIDYAAFNVWWITVNETSYTYNLRRIGSPRVFTVTFDLTKPIALPPASWGW